MTVELDIESVEREVLTAAGAEAGRVHLVEVGGEGRRLEIVMGRPEARAIDDGHRGVEPPRPLAWDLLKSAVDTLGGTVEAVVITAVEEGRIFRAEVRIRQGEVEHRLAARPSDGLALAVRSPAARILAEEDVLPRPAVGPGTTDGPGTLPTS